MRVMRCVVSLFRGPPKVDVHRESGVEARDREVRTYRVRQCFLL